MENNKMTKDLLFVLIGIIWIFYYYFNKKRKNTVNKTFLLAGIAILLISLLRLFGLFGL
jgi:hypothetical protein